MSVFLTKFMVIVESVLCKKVAPFLYTYDCAEASTMLWCSSYHEQQIWVLQDGDSGGGGPHP